MLASSYVILMIKRFEGFRSTFYNDAGAPAVGYGHRLDYEEQRSDFETPISREEAENLLASDLLDVENFLSGAVVRRENYFGRLFYRTQADALISFVFNVGSGNFEQGSIPGMLRRGELHKVPDKMREYVFSDGKKLQGLVERREFEARLFEYKPIM